MMTQNNLEQSVSANETKTPSKFSKNWIIFSAIGGAVLAILLLAVYLFSQKNNPVQNADITPTVIPSVISASATPTASPTNMATPKPDTNVQTSNPKVMQFTSEELGITFKYQDSYADGCDGCNIKVKRDGNRVYVYDANVVYMKYTDGQYIEVYTKDNAVSLESAIHSKFLEGYSDSNCIITKYETTLPSGYEAKQINFKKIYDLYPSGNICPVNYTSWGGLMYFEASNLRPDKYVFFSIGNGSNIKGDSDSATWQNTLRFIP